MKLKTTAARGWWNLRRKLRLTPMQSVMRYLSSHGLPPRSLDTLEMFGGYGTMITRDALPYVKSLEAWEIDPDCRSSLCANLPGATIRIVDTFQQMTETPNKYGLVIADTWPWMFGGHCEHFEIFPGVFSLLQPRAAIVLNILLDMNLPRLRATYPSLDEHLARRRAFYRNDDPARVSLETMVRTIEGLARPCGVDIAWWTAIDRYFLYGLRKRSKNWRLCYLVLGLEQAGDGAPRSAPGEGNGVARLEGAQR